MASVSAGCPAMLARVDRPVDVLSRASLAHARAALPRVERRPYTTRPHGGRSATCRPPLCQAQFRVMSTGWALRSTGGFAWPPPCAKAEWLKSRIDSSSLDEIRREKALKLKAAQRQPLTSRLIEAI